MSQLYAGGPTLGLPTAAYGATPPFGRVPAKDRSPPNFGRLPVIGNSSLGPEGGYHPQVDVTAGLPSAPEVPCAPRELRLVPRADIR